MIDAGLPVTAFFTTREGGTSETPYASLNVGNHVGDSAAAVSKNREIVSRHAGAPMVYLTGEHGTQVVHVDSADQTLPRCDALVSTTPGLGVAATVADCVPILLHDAATGAVAAVHAGRLGVFHGVLDAAVASLRALREPDRATGELSASIGPAVCGRCYEVPAQMREDVAARHPAAFAHTSWGTPSLDLPRAMEVRLQDLGCAVITRVDECTLESPRLFSHRRDGTTGRLAGVIVCEG